MKCYENRHSEDYDFYERDDSVEWDIFEDKDIYCPSNDDEEIPF